MEIQTVSRPSAHEQTVVTIDDARWEALFVMDESQDLLDKLADENLPENKAGRIDMIFADKEQNQRKSCQSASSACY